MQTVAPKIAQPELPKEQLIVITKDGRRHVFFVEVATTRPQQVAGLMLRTSLPPDGGMLFDWGEPRNNKMWMRDTIVPLDIFFIGISGTIDRIVENNAPHSLEIVDSQGLVRATLELLAGTAQRCNLTVGDRLLGPIFQSDS